MLQMTKKMAANEKISKALESAANHVEKSLEAVGEDKEGLVDDSVWYASADLEYALFLFSINIESQGNKSKWKPNPRFKTGEVKPPLMKVKDLLNESEKHVENEKMLEAYQTTSVARSYLLKLQKYFTKKKRKALKTKQKKRDRIDFSSL